MLRNPRVTDRSAGLGKLFNNCSSFFSMLKSLFSSTRVHDPTIGVARCCRNSWRGVVPFQEKAR